MGVCYWPPEIPRCYRVESYREAFAALGFAVAAGQAYEEGYEKVALWAKAGRPTHAARQIDGKFWTSKLGRMADIKHELGGVSGNEYGEVLIILRRPLAPSS